MQARLPLLRELLIASKGTCYLFSLPPSAAEAPAKSCLKFWSGLLSISMDWRNPRTLVSIRMAVMSTQVQRATSSHRLSHPFLLTHPCSPYSAPSSHLLLLPKVFVPSGSVPHPLAHLCPSPCDPLLSGLILLFGETDREPSQTWAEDGDPSWTLGDRVARESRKLPREYQRVRWRLKLRLH